MSQDESSTKRKSVKRTGKRFTVDMRKELDSLIYECFEDDGEEPTSPTSATVENSLPEDVGTESEVQSPTTSIPQDTAPPTTQQEEETVSPEKSPDQSKPVTTPRKLIYSHSQNKLSLSSITANGNGRSSNPIPVDANYGNQDTQAKQESSDENQSVTATSPTSPTETSEVKRVRMVPALNIETSEKRLTPTNEPSSPSQSKTFEAKGRQSLFFDNAATKVVRAVIITTNTVNDPQGPYTVYVMEAYSESGHVIQNVSKRFKNFSELVEKLKGRAPELVSMLPHRAILGNMAAKRVNNRKIQLQALLDYILSHKELSRSVDVLAFFRNPTLLKQLASKPDMEGFLQRDVGFTEESLLIFLAVSESAELKSAVVLRWLTVYVSDEATFTIELRPWQYLLFPSDPQSRPVSIRAGSRDEMICWARALHVAKSAVNDVIMLKKTMLQEEDATSEMELGDDEDDILTPRQPAEPYFKPLSLSASADALLTRSTTVQSISSESNQTPLSPRKPALTTGDLTTAPSSPRGTDASHRNRNQTQLPNNVAAPAPKTVVRSHTESQLSLPRKPEQPPLAPASSSPTTPRFSTPVSKLKDFAEQTESQPLSRFEARMALKGPPKYLDMRFRFSAPRKPENNPLLLTSHLPTPDTEENILLSATKQQYIRGASANKLFEKVIDHTFTGTEYLDLVSAFLIGYRTFASPTELLDRLIQAYPDNNK